MKSDFSVTWIRNQVRNNDQQEIRTEEGDKEERGQKAPRDKEEDTPPEIENDPRGTVILSRTDENDPEAFPVPTRRGTTSAVPP